MENEKIKHLLNEIVHTCSQKPYKELYIYSYRHLYRFALSILRSPEDAEEVVSDFFLMVWQKKESLAAIENPRLYFFVSIKNSCLNKQKLQKTNNYDFQEEYLVQFKSPFFDPSELMLSKESVNLIMDSINQLPPKCKQIFRLIKEDGLKYKEVSELLNLSVKTVEAQMAIAVRRISNSYNFKQQFPELHSILSGKK